MSDSTEDLLVELAAEAQRLGLGYELQGDSMNRFIVFAGGTPAGGFNDYKGESTDLDKAKELAEDFLAGSSGPAWAHVLDAFTRKIVWKEDVGGKVLLNETAGETEQI